MSKQDRQGVRSPAELERKYDLGAIEIVKRATKNNAVGITKTNQILEDFVKQTIGSLDDLQSQIDGSITTHFYDGVPTLENKPASEWLTEEEKNNHIGDLYYDQGTGYAYRFMLSDGVYNWIELADNDIAEALALANAAQDTADSKRRIFVDTPYPPYDNGDLWFHNQEIFICQNAKPKGDVYKDGDFVTATKYTDDTAAKKVAGDLDEFIKNVEANYSTTVEMESAITKSEEKISSLVSKTITEKADILQQQIDGAIETFTGSESPTLENAPANSWTTDEDKDTHIGDLYIVNSDGGDLAGFYYRFEKKDSVYQWVLLKDNEITKALQDAKEANEKAAQLEKTLEENYSTTMQTKSLIEQTAESITSEVGKTLEENYSTTSETKSLIEQTAESITSEVGQKLEENYSTTEDTKTLIEQTAESITLEVIEEQPDKVVASINLSTGGVIRLVGNRIAIESDYFTLSEDGKIKAVDGVFEGSITSSNAKILGGEVRIEAGDDSYPAVSVSKGVNETYLTAKSITTGNDQTYFGVIGNSCSLIMVKDNSTRFYISDTECRAEVDTTIFGDFVVYDGFKSRLAKTKSYNNRLLYCYEMSSPIFGDVGHGVIGDDGLCYIDIDQIFFETVDMRQSYQVFLQSYAEKNVYVVEKQPQYFVVKGEPNTEFDWELKAKQLDFSIERLDEMLPKDNYEETDYIALSSAYLNEYEQEVLNYE